MALADPPLKIKEKAMSKSINQKIKQLVLWDILLHNTDENRALSTDEIIALLKEKNIDVARKVLPEDIALLKDERVRL